MTLGGCLVTTMLERSWRPESDTAVVETSPHHSGRQIIYHFGLRLWALWPFAQPQCGSGALRRYKRKREGVCAGERRLRDRERLDIRKLALMSLL